jgi:hypothetical protein
MKLFIKDKDQFSENSIRSIRTLLLTQGFGRTLDYFCTFSVFSIA